MTNLIGTPDALTSRISAYRDAGIGQLLAKLDGPSEQQLATLRLLMQAVRGCR